MYIRVIAGDRGSYSPTGTIESNKYFDHWLSRTFADLVSNSDFGQRCSYEHLIKCLFGLSCIGDCTILSSILNMIKLL